jgi:ABC-type branched-subunit amino acid transport system substrate-binding protein
MLRNKTVGLIVSLAALTMLFFGCKAGKEGSDVLKIGVLYSTTGAFSISETPMLNSALMAIDEINTAGGIKGKKIEAIVCDYGSDPAMAAEKAQKLILEDKVVAIVGTNSSSTRLAVIPTIEEYDSVLVYNTFYEGEAPSPNVIYTNTVPSQQIEAYIPWIVKNLGPKIYFVGSDYEFPRKSIKFAKEMALKFGGEIVGEEYVPTGHTEFSSIINKIKQAAPDVVFSAIAGDSNVPFYKQYKQYGINSSDIPICSIATHEGSAKGMGAEAAAGHYSSFAYFNTIDTPESKAFIQKYGETYGTQTTVTNQTAAAYHGVKLLAAALGKAKSMKSKDIIAAFSGLEIMTPGGMIKMDETNHHAWLNSYIGKINESCTFDIMYKSEGLVKPVAE